MAPLSEHEKAQLRLLEEQLHTEDPKFVKAMRSQRMNSGKQQRGHTKRGVVLALGVFTVGIIILLAGVTMHSIIVGILGGVVALASYFILSSGKSVASNSAPASTPHPKTRSAFMENLERQWDERKKNEL